MGCNKSLLMCHKPKCCTTQLIYAQSHRVAALSKWSFTSTKKFLLTCNRKSSHSIRRRRKLKSSLYGKGIPSHWWERIPFPFFQTSQNPLRGYFMHFIHHMIKNDQLSERQGIALAKQVTNIEKA